MKHADVQKIFEAGLISDDERRKIIEHFQLKEDDGKFLAIISFIGAILVVSGVILLIGANWDDIPRGVKIAAGLCLMLGAHAGGWYLREVRRNFRKTGEALHLIGSGLFLGNIALIGQIYHLSSRTPNAFLLWWVGIAALPWLLRSKAQHVLLLLAFGTWFGLEAAEPDSLIYFGNDVSQILLYALFGLAYVGLGHCLRRTQFAEFASATEKLGLLLFNLFAFPLTWGILRYRSNLEFISPWVFPVLAGITLLVLLLGVGGLRDLTRQWRWTWTLTLIGGIALLAGALYLAPDHDTDIYRRGDFGYHWIAAIGIFVFCLLQVQAGIQERSPFMINAGVVFIALDIIAIYLVLFGSMARTGLMFLVSGAFLIVFGIFLEQRRRALMKQIKVMPTN
jgi:uncharacterized membrane protein